MRAVRIYAHVFEEVEDDSVWIVPISTPNGQITFSREPRLAHDRPRWRGWVPPSDYGSLSTTSTRWILGHVFFDL